MRHKSHRASTIQIVDEQNLVNQNNETVFATNFHLREKKHRLSIDMTRPGPNVIELLKQK